ncbi:MAG TPA: hypothetical protein VJG83_05490, partial [archaeon]|nr:hypothetical protein [archaeon]
KLHSQTQSTPTRNTQTPKNQITTPPQKTLNSGLKYKQQRGLTAGAGFIQKGLHIKLAIYV